jgi:hypothetical protein
VRLPPHPPAGRGIVKGGDKKEDNVKEKGRKREMNIEKIMSK